MATKLSTGNNEDSSNPERVPTPSHSPTSGVTPSIDDNREALIDLVTKAKNGKFKEVWEILDKNEHYLNKIPDRRAWGVLHQAIFWGNEEYVLKALSYPGCDPFIKTKQDRRNNYGPGRSPEDLARTQNIRDIVTRAQERYKLTQANKSSLLEKNDKYRSSDKCNILKLGGYLSGPDNCDWDTFLIELKDTPYLINSVDPFTGLSPLHKAVIAEKSNIITVLFELPFSNPRIETIDAPKKKYPPGKTLEGVANSKDIISIIIDRREYINRLSLTSPVRFSHWKARILREFFLNILQEYNGILCPLQRVVNEDVDLALLLYEVFTHINSGNNWLLAKQEVTFIFRNISFEYFQLLDEYSVMTEEKSRFFAKLVQIYTKEEEKMIYPELDSMFQSLQLQESKDVLANRELGTYALILSALLMYWGELSKFTGTTYRGVILNPQELTELVKGYVFLSPNFMSCSLRVDSPKYHSAKCMFEIDNSEECLWSPRSIGKFAAKADESEYLYPCGARFMVINSIHNRINLKLLSKV